MAKKSTIADVAKKAGVGKVTVSYVLNGQAETARISKATAERILKAATELNYRPNAHARNLVRKKADAIGVVFQFADYFGRQSNFISEVLRSVCQACVEADVDVMLHTRPDLVPLTEANMLSDGRVDGVVILRDQNDKLAELLKQRNFPSVLFFSRSDDPDIASVSCDNYNGGRLAVNHLLHLGHRNIAMLKGRPGSVDSNDRFHGYRSALESAGVPFDPANVIQFDDPKTDREALISLMSKKNRPTAIFAWSDDSAIEAIRILNYLELRVPEDVSIVGFDGTVAGERCNPPLTSIKQPIEEIARESVQLTLQLAQGNLRCNPKVVLAPSLEIRLSTAKLDFNSPSSKDNEVPTK